MRMNMNIYGLTVLIVAPIAAVTVVLVEPALSDPPAKRAASAEMFAAPGVAPKAPASSHTQQQWSTATQLPAPRLPMPDAQTLLTLVRTSMLTLNDALRSGNFTVLRDTASPEFRKVNTAARLSLIFAKLIDSNTDLAPAAVLVPQLKQEPSINERGMLQMSGFYPMADKRIDFAVFFQPTERGWQLYGISVQPAPLNVAAR